MENVSSAKESVLSSSSSFSSDTQTSFPRDENGFKIFDDSYFACPFDGNEKGETSQVRFAPANEGMELYPTLKMFLAGQEVPVYKIPINQNRVWKADAGTREYAAYAKFSLKGKAKVFLQCAFNPFEDVTIRPLGMNVPYEIDSSRFVISFTIDSPGQYVIETRYRTLHLFVDELKEENLENCIVFKKGIHDKSNDSRISSNNEITVHSNEKIYLEDGAVVRAKFIANSAKGFKIFGPGTIDGSLFPRNPNEGTATVPLDFSFCSDFSLSDFFVADPAGWAFNIYFCSSVGINNVKIISSRSNGDGISIQSCKDVDVEGCFLRTWDDSLVVKNYVDYRNGNEGETENISFSNCLIITDLAQSMEIGYETIGQKMAGITFSNITVLHAYHKAVMSIHNANNAEVTNVRYENITVEDCDVGLGDGNPYLFDFDCSYSPTWSDNHKKTSLGFVCGVEVSNVKVIAGVSSPKVKVTGSMETREGYPSDEHLVKDVSFKNVSLYGQKLDEAYQGFQKDHCQSVVFENDGVATGAHYKHSDVSSFGGNIIRAD